MAIEFLHSLDVAGDLQVDGAIKDSNGTDKSSNWNDAYSWGDHSLEGYLTSASNYYLSGASFDTSNGKLTLTVSGATNQTVDLDGRWLTKTHQGGDDYFAGHHSEGRLIANAYLSNDLANLRLRGGALTATNTTFTDVEVDRMFDGTASIAGIPTTDFENGPVVIEITIPRVLRYGAYVGIGFGNSTWRCKKVKIEAHSNGAWVTCTDLSNNAYEDVYTNIPGNSSGGTDKFRITLDDPNNNVRVCHIWAYNYDSRLWSETMMPRAGGTMYGALTINGTLNSHTIPSGTGTLALTSDIPSKAADSDKLDGIDSTGFVKQLGDGSDPDYQTPSSRRLNPNAKNPTNEHYAISTFGNGGNVTGQLATHFQTGNLYSRGYNTAWSDWRRYHNSLDFSTTDVANGVTAYGWGDHSKAGYGSSTFDGKYSSLTGIPTTFAPSAHNHDSDYLKLTAKAADSEKLDGIDSSRVIYGDNVTGTTSITGAAFNPSGHLKSGFYRVSKTSSTIPNATSVNFALHTSYNGDGNTAGFDIAVNDSTTSQIYFRPATGGGRGNWQTFFTTGNFTDNSTNWDAAYKWGDHADAGYGTSSFDGKYSSLTGTPTIPTDFVSKSSGGTFTGDLNVHSGTGTGALSVGRTSTQAIKLHVNDNVNTIFAYQDSDGDGDHQFILRRDFQGTGASDFKIQKNGADQLTIDKSGNTVVSGTISATGYNKTNWDTAHGWGNHASAGYSKSDTIFNGGDIGNPVIVANRSADSILHYAQSGNWTGAIKITLPGTHTSNWSMLVLRITVYEYKSEAHTTFTVSGHDWTSGWYNKAIKKWGNSSKNIDFGYSTSANTDCLIVGEVDSAWSYGHVTVDVVSHPSFYSSSMNIDSGWKIEKVTSLSGITRSNATNEQVHDSGDFSTSDVSKGVTAHGWGNHADEKYLTSYSETSDLEDVRSRDNSISGAINFLPDTGAILQVDGQTIIDRQTTNGAITIGHDDSIILAGGDTSSTLNNNINNAEETVFIGAEGGLKVFAFPDNMSGGWSARKEWRFQNDGDTDFPGKLYPSNQATHYVDSTRISNWQTAYGWGDHGSAGYVTRSAPNAPVVSSKIVGDTIEVSITASTTGNIDQYLVFSSVVGSDFGLISVIPPTDMSATMSVIDSSFAKTGKIDYRVYAVKNGVYSSAGTTSQTYSASGVEPTNLSIIPMNEAFYVQWDVPSTNARFVEKYNVYHDSHDVEASINRNNATLLYSGNRLSHMVGSSDSKFNKFWVEVTIA